MRNEKGVPEEFNPTKHDHTEGGGFVKKEAVEHDKKLMQRAEGENAKRSFLEKVLRTGKISFMDIAHEDAFEENKSREYAKRYQAERERVRKEIETILAKENATVDLVNNQSLLGKIIGEIGYLRKGSNVAIEILGKKEYRQLLVVPAYSCEGDEMGYVENRIVGLSKNGIAEPEKGKKLSEVEFDKDGGVGIIKHRTVAWADPNDPYAHSSMGYYASYVPNPEKIISRLDE